MGVSMRVLISFLVIEDEFFSELFESLYTELDVEEKRVHHHR